MTIGNWDDSLLVPVAQRARAVEVVALGHSDTCAVAKPASGRAAIAARAAAACAPASVPVEPGNGPSRVRAPVSVMRLTFWLTFLFLFYAWR